VPNQIKKSSRRIILKTFNNEASLNAWIEKMQRATNTYYSLQTGPKHHCHKKYQYYFCQHFARLQNSCSQTPRKTSRRKKCGTVPNFACTSRITIHKHLDVGKFTVKFVPEHSHECKEEYLKHQPFPKSVRNYILAKLTIGVGHRRIIEDLRAEKWIKHQENPDAIVLDIMDLLTTR
jgi:hypothetical protein